MNKIPVEVYKLLDPKPSPGSDKIISDYNVCGPNYYVESSDWRNNNPTSPKCHKCPSKNDINYVSQPTFKKMGTANRKLWVEKNNMNYPLPEITSFTSMCDPSPDVWYPAQQSENSSQQYIKEYNWAKIGTIISGGKGSPEDIDLATKWYTDRDADRMSTDDLNKQKRLIKYPGTIGTMRDAISEYTNVPCLPSPPKQFYDHIKPPLKKRDSVASAISCPTSTLIMGSDNIIHEQYRDWETYYFNTQKDKPKKKVDFSMFYGDVGPPNDKFEGCMNDIFTDNYNKVDREQIKELKANTHWRKLTDDNISFIRRKLQMFLMNSNQEQLLDCMHKHLYLDVSICDAGLTEQMAKILQIIMYIVGYNFHLNTAKNESDRKKLKEIIDDLGPLVPRVIGKIIDISEAYENKHCQGTSYNTQLLKELHTQVFQGGTNEINFDLGLSKLISSDTSDTEFNRSTILAVLSIAFLKYF